MTIHACSAAVIAEQPSAVSALGRRFMPVVDIELNVSPDQTTMEAIALECTRMFAGLLDSSCASVLVCFSQGALFIDGSAAPAARVVVRSAACLGLQTKRLLCQRVAEILTVHCGIDSARVFLQTMLVLPDDAWNVTAEGPCCVLDRITRTQSTLGPRPVSESDPIATPQASGHIDVV